MRLIIYIPHDRGLIIIAIEFYLITFKYVLRIKSENHYFNGMLYSKFPNHLLFLISTKIKMITYMLFRQTHFHSY